MTTHPATRFVTRRWYLPVHILGFFAAQAVYAYFYAHSALSSNLVLQSTIRPLFWIGPVVMALWVLGKNALDYLKLRGHVIRGLAWGSVIGGAIILYNVLAVYLSRGHVAFKYASLGQAAADFFSVYGIILMATEEILFRGFFLQQMAERLGFTAANLAQALLFMLLHFIGWAIMGMHVSFLAAGAGILVFALVEGYVLKKTDSLWACVLVHICNNFIAGGLI